MKRRLLRTLITSAVMSSLIVTPVLATPQDDAESLERKKSQAETQAETQVEELEQKKNEAEAQAEAQVNELEQKKNEAEAQAKSVNNELVQLLVDYDALQSDMETQEKRIVEAEADLKDAEANEKKQYDDMKLRIKYMYEEGDSSYVSTLFSAESYSDLVNKAEYIKKVHDYDRKMLNKYVETKNEVAELKDNLEEGQAEMQALSEEMDIQKQNLEVTLTQMRSQIEDFDNQLTEAKEEAAEELRRIQEEQRLAEEAEARAREEAEAAARAEQAAKDAEEERKNDSQDSQDSQDSSKDDKDEDRKPESGASDNDKTDKDDDKKDDQDDKNDDVPAAKPGNAALGQQIADMGCNYIGNKYVYGGTSLTGGIDGSGFVQQIHKKFGISTPRTSGAIRGGGKSVRYADRMPGDVICYSGHVAIYIGNNKIVHASNSAPYPKGGIKITSPANYRTVLAVRRYW